ncbi:MAG: DNA cytosine methyltransferase [Lachnospiraceae bacterium]|nr:DNA cytosine methyltransferase [Lachnospiraceae bacterium]
MEQISIFDYLNEEQSGNKLTQAEIDRLHPRMVSLFSGCGGLDLGFKQAGYDIVYANDFDIDAQRVYKANFGEIDERNILDVLEEEVPACDILTGGFPCQPFSNAGNRRGVKDSRGNLYKECLRMIQSKAPKVVVLENVRGLLSTKDENGGLLIETIVKNLEETGTGYNVNYQLVNASDYGVPQNRVRVVLVAFRKDLGKTFVFPPKQPKEKLNIGSLLDVPEDIPNQVDWPFSPQVLNLIKYIPEGGSWKSIPYEYLPDRFRRIADNMKRYHAPNMYRRFARTEIAGTITAAAQPENCGIIHPTENRRYNIREIARIQTFPDDFIFFTEDPKSVTGMYKVIGNAVPPVLAKVIGCEIKAQLGLQLTD